MQSKKLTLALNIIVVLALVFGLALPCLFVNTATDMAYAAVGNYYSSITANGGTALLGQLHDLIVSTHNTYTSYDDCKGTKVQQTDPGPNGGVLEFYTQQSIMKFSGTTGTWNREHVWAQSLSNGLWGTSGGGSDMHHIRPSEAKLNGNRGNKKYGEVGSSGSEEWSYNTDGSKVALGGHSSSSTFEPLDNVKGDVARIVMYVYTHYNNASNVGGTKESSKTHGNLPITNIISASSSDVAWQMLLKWNKLDPVDEIERTRNEAVYGIQGNRNPFIDNESYADAIWGGGTIEKIDLQSLTLTPSTLSLAVGAQQTLNVKGSPAGANAAVTWTSSNANVATVSNGVVKAIASGSATIIATSVENPSIKAEATITVTDTTSVPSGDVDEFISNVSAISSAVTIEARFNAIKAALNSYNQLTATEKQTSNVAEAYQNLQRKITAYNTDVANRNAAMDNATKNGAYAICGVTLAAVALIAVLNRKFN